MKTLKIICFIALVLFFFAMLFPPIKRTILIKKYNLSNSDLVFECEQDENDYAVNFSQYGLLNKDGICCFFAINETNSFRWLSVGYYLNGNIVDQRFFWDENLNDSEKFYYPMKTVDWSKFKENPVWVHREDPVYCKDCLK